jgi:hypothetical protein
MTASLKLNSIPAQRKSQRVTDEDKRILAVGKTASFEGIAGFKLRISIYRKKKNSPVLYFISM